MRTYTSLDMHDYTFHICVCRVLSAYETCVQVLLPVVVMLVIVFRLQQRFPLVSCNFDCRHDTEGPARARRAANRRRRRRASQDLAKIQQRTKGSEEA